MMEEAKAGSSWSSPIWYGRWRIYQAALGNWLFSHDDFDGAEDANDMRCGYEHTVEECKAEIDAWEEANG